jgi:hypothetical protein
MPEIRRFSLAGAQGAHGGRKEKYPAFPPDFIYLILVDFDGRDAEI